MFTFLHTVWFYCADLLRIFITIEEEYIRQNQSVGDSQQAGIVRLTALLLKETLKANGHPTAGVSPNPKATVYTEVLKSHLKLGFVALALK